MNRTLTCIGCPMGCSIEVELDEAGNFVDSKGWSCKIGERYAKEIKIKNPEEVIGNLEDKVADLTKQLIEANDTLQDIYGSLAYKVAKRIFIRKKKR